MTRNGQAPFGSLSVLPPHGNMDNAQRQAKSRIFGFKQLKTAGRFGIIEAQACYFCGDDIL